MARGMDRSVAIVLGRGPSPDESSDEDARDTGPESSDEDARDAAEGLIHAVKVGDADLVLEAFHALLEACAPSDKGD